MIPRPYQQESIDQLYRWLVDHPGVDQSPILVLPTGAGKSIVIAELVRLLFDTWPDEHPRTVVIVPSKELAEQNADKLLRILPNHIRVGYYSASLGKRCPTADVIVATIGSIARNAHLLGNIRCVMIDECHLVNPDGAGQYRQFLNDLAKYCVFRVVGLTATPFRGNGVWLTIGKDPLFCAIAHTVKVQTLLDSGHVAPLVRPSDVIKTRIDTDDVKTVNGDYAIDELSDCVGKYLTAAAEESVTLAADRKKWIAFLPTVANAGDFVACLHSLGVSAALVCGETPKKDRERLIAEFRAGNIRCLVTVLALAVGFDVPDVDCILWLRPTKSPVLYVQGSGRGMRICEGKRDCLWLDFSDTTDRLGPVDAIKGRKKRDSREDQGAPFAICPECGAQVRPANALVCPECGAVVREEEEKDARKASEAPIMLHQVQAKIVRYEVDQVTYHEHHKDGSPPSMRVEYWSGLRRVACEWVCFEHTGFARAKAEQWWSVRHPFVGDLDKKFPTGTKHALVLFKGIEPSHITVNESGKYPEIIKCEFEQKQIA